MTVRDALAFAGGALARAGEPDTLALRLDGEAVQVTFRRDARARRLILKVFAPTRTVALTAPGHASLAEARRFLEAKRDWVAARLAALPEPIAVAAQAWLPLRGAPTRIRHDSTARGVVWSGEGGAEIRVGAASEDIGPRLQRWLKAEARRDLEIATAAYARRIDRPVERLRIADPRSRWGSASSSGTLSFSFRLVMAPAFVLDYVAAHEVAHLLEMNHGPRFWSHVAALCPGHKAARAWLKREGGELHRYRFEPAPVSSA